MDLLYNENIKLKIVFENEGSRKEYYYKIFNIITDDEIGLCGIRLDFNKDNYYLGNIEYEIYEKYRGNHYAEQACYLLKNVALAKNIDYLYITANPKNLASIKTILNLGANLIEVTKIPRKVKLYKSHDRKISIYKWDIIERRR